MRSGPKRILIVGGGITGLSAAFYTKKLYDEHGISVEITVVEKSNSFGGKIKTIHRDGFVIEKGPDSFLARKQPIVDLTAELGLLQELVGTNPNAKKTYILHRGRLHRIPPGLVLGIPTQIRPFLLTGLISPQGKARASLDLIIPRRIESTDESLGDFLERRLGSEVLEHIAEPLLAGIYAGDTRALSLQSTFPQFRSVEQRYRSLIIGMTKNRKQEKKSDKIPFALRDSMFLSYRNGLKTLVERLIESLIGSGIELISGRNVESLIVGNDGYEAFLRGDNSSKFDGVIVAVPAFAAADLLSPYADVGHLANIPYVSVANVIMAFDQDQIRHKLDGTGFVVPRSEGRWITACTWISSKWLHSCPDGKVLLRCYIGRSGQEQWVHLSDEELVNKVCYDIQELMGIDSRPLWHEVTRWQNSMPQYPVGHLEQLRRTREELSRRLPGVLIAGAGYEGVGLPDCIQQGKSAAEQMLTYNLQNHQSD